MQSETIGIGVRGDDNYAQWKTGGSGTKYNYRNNSIFFMREKEREMHIHAVRIAFCNSAALDNVWINNGIQYEIEL